MDHDDSPASRGAAGICQTGALLVEIALVVGPACGSRLCSSARSASTGVVLRQLLSLAQSGVDQVEAEIPEARIFEIQADQLDEPLWVA